MINFKQFIDNIKNFFVKVGETKDFIVFRSKEPVNYSKFGSVKFIDRVNEYTHVATTSTRNGNPHISQSEGKDCEVVAIAGVYGVSKEKLWYDMGFGKYWIRRDAGHTFSFIQKEMGNTIYEIKLVWKDGSYYTEKSPGPQFYYDIGWNIDNYQGRDVLNALPNSGAYLISTTKERKLKHPKQDFMAHLGSYVNGERFDTWRNYTENGNVFFIGQVV